MYKCKMYKPFWNYSPILCREKNLIPSQNLNSYSLPPITPLPPHIPKSYWDLELMYRSFPQAVTLNFDPEHKQ